MRASLKQVAEVGGVGAEGVFDDDDRQEGMLLAKRFEPAAGGISLAVVLGLTVLLDDRLGCQRDDFLEVGMDEGGRQQLMGIGDVAVAMLLHQARGAMDLGGGKIGRAVQRHQVVAVQIDETFERLAALQATEDLAERGPQARGIRQRSRKRPHLGVAGDAVDPIDGAEVDVGIATAIVEGQQRWVLSENIAKADIRASSKGISTSPDRGSGREPKWERRERNRASAERVSRASPRARAIASHCFDRCVR